MKTIDFLLGALSTALLVALLYAAFHAGFKAGHQEGFQEAQIIQMLPGRPLQSGPKQYKAPHMPIKRVKI